MNPIIEILQMSPIGPWFAVATAVVTLASAVAATTPTPKEGTPRAKAYKVIDFLALNVVKAKQK